MQTLADVGSQFLWTQTNNLPPSKLYQIKSACCVYIQVNTDTCQTFSAEFTYDWTASSHLKAQYCGTGKLWQSSFHRSHRLCWITDHRAIKLKKKFDFTRNPTDISSFFEILKEALKSMGALPSQKRGSPLHISYRRKTKQSPDLLHPTGLEFFY